MIITLSSLFTTPLGTGIPFNWKDLTPVAMMALDEFILWVNADKPYKTAKDQLSLLKTTVPIVCLILGIALAVLGLVLLRTPAEVSSIPESEPAPAPA